MEDKVYIDRCFDLALQGRGNVSPNPLVGAVIVHEDRIIGEGYHMKYGAAHAEVNAVNSVSSADRSLLSKSTLYINLEPCCIHGNTPPCTDLIIRHKIPKVVFSCIDQTAGVKGKSIQILRDAGCEVSTGIEAEIGALLVAERNVFADQGRPYVILKYAQSADGFLGKKGKQVWLSNPLAKRLVHKWRSEVDAIIVGTNTAKVDDPQLNNRLYFGKSPLRIVLDRNAELDRNLQLFNQSEPTWVITENTEQTDQKNLRFITLPFDQQLIPNILKTLHSEQYSSIMVEGGKQLLDSFINQGLWDEARVLEAPTLLYEGIPAPVLNEMVYQESRILDNKLSLFYRKSAVN